MYIFAFAHTYKDKNYAASSGELTPKEIRITTIFILYLLQIFVLSSTRSMIQFQSIHFMSISYIVNYLTLRHLTRKYLFLLYLAILVFSGCCTDDLVSGYCVIYYENIENFPDSKISVNVSGNKITNHHYTLEPFDSILLSIDYTGDFYYLEVPGVRKDSITNIVVNRYGCQDSQVKISLELNYSHAQFK
jgi:hypothetical protein